MKRVTKLVLSNLDQILRSGNLTSFFSRVSSVKAGRGWVTWFNRLGDLILSGRRPSWTRSAVVFSRWVFHTVRKRGTRGLVIYLKGCSVLLMQAAGGMKIKDTGPLGARISRSSDGLPRIIPSPMRALIRKGDRRVIRFWLSLFNLYRVIPVQSLANFSTITSPGKPRLWSDSLISSWLMEWGVGPGPGALVGKLTSIPKSPIYKSAPTKSRFLEWDAWWGSSGKGQGSHYSSSFMSVGQAAVSLVAQSSIYASFRKLEEAWAPITWHGQRLASPSLCHRIEGLAARFASTLNPGPIGGLGLKEEAAGKVRVFAMVDPWTQWLLKPLHLAIFEVLQTLPTDGTMDQLKPINRLIEKGYARFWSFDLSAATDRLPVWLQAGILNHFLGGDLGTHWANLLVGRAYAMPSGPNEDLLRPADKAKGSVHYAVGQPMGALSSWAMLALTHHFLIHVAARRGGHRMGTFWAYAVLGDDVVIADGRVARLYSQLMLELGVEIGFAKSLVSRSGCLEFAKRYYHNLVNASVIPLRELAAAMVNGFASIEFARVHAIPFSRLVSVLGYGFRVKARLPVLQSLPKRVRNLAVVFFSPMLGSSLTLSQWVQMRAAVLPLILNSSKKVIPVNRVVDAILERVEAKLHRYVDSVYLTPWLSQKTRPKGKLQDIPFPDSRQVTNSNNWPKDWFWWSYLTVSDQLKTLVAGLKSDLMEIRELCLALQARPCSEGDLYRVWEVYSLSMLFLTVRQMLMPSKKSLIATLDKVITLRRSLVRDLQISLDPNKAWTLAHGRVPIVWSLKPKAKWNKRKGSEKSPKC